MIFILVGILGILNLHYGWIDTVFVSTDIGYIGCLLMILMGVVEVQTDKIIDQLKDKE